MEDCLNSFHQLVGQTIMFCQLIENDLKVIYASMLKGEINYNFDIIEIDSFGKMVQKLEKLDNSDGNPYISKSYYSFLRQMCKKRNHWCHNAYTIFIYKDDFQNSDEFNEEFAKLEKENKEFGYVQKKIEDIKIEVFKKYRNNEWK